MIISELHFFQVKREPFLGDAMELDDALFGVTPKPFNTVDVDLAVTKMLAMIDIDVPVTAEHERIIAFELVSVNDAAAPDHFDRQIEQCLGFDVLNRLHMDQAVSLEDTEHRNLVGRSSSALPFAFAAKIGLVHFDCPVHPVWKFDVVPDRLPDDLDSLKGCRIAQPHLAGDLPGRYLQFKELDDPQPLFGADLDPIDPPVTEVMEGVLAPLTTVSFANQPVDFVAVAPAAKNMPFFPAEFTDIQPGTVFTFDDELEGFQCHLHYYNLVQKRL